jgi:putrescine transport system permease protein
MDLGCRPGQVFFLVTLPNIVPSLMAAWLLTFTLSFDDVVVSEFLSGPGVTTLPQVIFSYARRGVNPSIYAAATLLMVVVTLAVLIYTIYLARQQRRKSPFI